MTNATGSEPDPSEASYAELLKLLGGPAGRTTQLAELLPGIHAWFATPIPGASADEWHAVGLVRTPNPDASCEEPIPGPLAQDAPWYCLSFDRQVGTGEQRSHGVEFWYPAGEEWRAVIERVEWSADSLIGFEAMLQPKSSDLPLLDYPSVHTVISTGIATRAKLRRVYATWLDELVVVDGNAAGD